jgi:hypothetical protein
MYIVLMSSLQECLSTDDVRRNCILNLINLFQSVRPSLVLGMFLFQILSIFLTFADCSHCKCPDGNILGKFLT